MPTSLEDFLQTLTFYLCRLVAVAGYIDSVVAAKQNAARFGYSISPNRELVALGAGNLMASFLPGPSSNPFSVYQC